VPSEGHVKGYPKRRRRVIKDMNKKYVLFILPLLILPLFAFGYAHFTDEVVKKYKLHVGTVYLNVTGFHVDYAQMPDPNSNGIIWGDELKVNIAEDADGVYNVEITANPITGGFILNSTLWLYNGGKLPFRLEFGTVKWDGPYDTEPDSTTAPRYPLIGANPLPMPPWSFSMTVYKWVKDPVTGIYYRTGPWQPTQTVYEPTDYIEVQQHIDFQQPGATDNWQRVWGCKWIKLWVWFDAQDAWTTLSSQTIGTPGVPQPPVAPP
jgi:hypothetical protein